MADQSKYVQAQAFFLAGAGATLGAVQLTLTSFTQIDGTLLTMADFGNKGFITLEPGNGTHEEQISFTGVTQNGNGTATLTGLSTVIMVSPYTETSGLAQSHTGGAVAVISNTSGFYNRFANKNDDETITGLWDFPSGASNPTIGNGSYVAPTLDTQIATKKYVDDVAVAGAPDANTTTKGIVQLPTQTQMDAGTSIGSTGAALVPTPANIRSKLLSDYVADTGSANTYAIAPTPAILAYTAGQIFTFKPANTNTGASTLNVSTLGTKALVRPDLTAVAPGDIVANLQYMVQYNGTSMVILSPALDSAGVMKMTGVATAPNGWILCDGTAISRTTYAVLFSAISTTYGAGDASTTFNLPDLRGRVPIGVGTGTGGGASGTGLPTGGDALAAVSRGTWKGENTHVLSIPEMPAHHHNVNRTTAGGSAGLQTAGDTPVDTLNTSDTGGGGAHNNIQPVMGVNFIMKL